ncbi:E3 ubiquitin-protein ligase MARCH4 [Toxocara canis]|uniref:E3 ubiquitin-protein ligase MARCH4 n=1 Tax=Toxocara canis TaxID=6265 RepID=A0A0B2UVE7_TOXCA|nr:E3 ubiquitin-protein ligase MARCH4 [Toxocara canis]
MGRPLCRICHLVHETPRNPLVAPCRCSGTMQYVHIGCLVHWLEISAKKMYPQPRCELCGYHYKRHPCIDLKRLRSPHIDANDIALNVVFVFAFVVMVICAALCIHFLRVTDQYHSLRLYRVSPTVMNNDDLTVITCSVLFFIAFFIAVFTQYRAEASIFRVFFRFWLINRNWQIRNYDISDDPEMLVEKLARREKVDVGTNTERCLMLV